MNEKLNVDLTRIPKELHLILELLKRGDSVNQNFLADINWDLFINLTMHHRLYPVIYTTLKKIHKKTYIPTFVIETLQEEYKRNTFQMLRFSAEMEQVSKLFTSDQIRTISLKGPTLGQDLYGDISLRTSGDLDVLIPIDQLQNADRLLLRQGYKKDDYIKTVLNDWKWRHHHVTYFHPEKMIKLEIHWRLHPGPAKEPSFNELWARRSKSPLTSYPVYTLKEKDLFIYLVSHGSRHGWSRLRWLLDIHQLMDKEMDWFAIRKLLRKYGLLHVGGQGMFLASQLIDTKVPKEIDTTFINKRSIKLAKQAIFYLESMINLHTDPVPINVARYHKRHLFSLMSTRQKLLFIVSFLYPYPEDADTLQLPKSLHFLYFPLRPFLWACRKARKSSFLKGGINNG